MGDDDLIGGSVHERRARRRILATSHSSRSLSPVRAKGGRGRNRRDVSPAVRVKSVSPPLQREASVKLSPKGGGHASMDMSIHILQGEDLAACDKNIFGKSTSSDPYVIVSILVEDKEIVVGQTKVQKATLNPKWNATVSKVIPPGSFPSDTYTLHLTLMDHDLLGDDDCMGIVKLPMTVETTTRESYWYDIPPDSAPKAKGRIQVAMETKLQYSMDSFLAGKKIGGEETSNPDEQSQSSHRASRLLPTLHSATSLLGVGTAAASKMLGAGKAVGSTALGAGTVVVTTAIGAGTAAAKGATTAASSAAGAVIGLTTPTALLGASAEPKEEEEMEDIYEEEEVLELQVTLHQGDDLVAKDTGRKVTSDPYAFMEVWPQGIPPDGQPTKAESLELGRSPTVHKTLFPVWNHTYRTFYVPMDQLDMEEAMLRVMILDDDFGLKEDDPMGWTDIHLQPEKHQDIKEKWYKVAATSATRASGRIQLSWQSKQTIRQKVVGQRKKPVVAKEIVEEADPDEDEVSPEEPVEKSALVSAERQRRNKSTQDGVKKGRIRRTTSVPEESDTGAGARKGRIRRTTSLPDEEEQRRKNRRRPKEGADGDRSKRVSSSKRLPGGTKSRPRRSTTPPNKTNPGDGKKSIRRTRSHLPKEGIEHSQRRSHSQLPSSQQRMTSSSRRTKDKDESRRTHGSRKEPTDGEEKRVSESGRSRRVASSRRKGLDDSGGSISSRRQDVSDRSSVEEKKRVSNSSRPSGSRKAPMGTSSSRRRHDIPPGSMSSHRSESSSGEEKKRISKSSRTSSRRRHMGASSSRRDGRPSRGESGRSGRHVKEDGSNRKRESGSRKTIPSPQSSKSGTSKASKHNSEDEPPKLQSFKDTGDSSEGANVNVKGILADCKRLREAYMEANPYRESMQKTQQPAGTDEDLLSLIRSTAPSVFPGVVQTHDSKETEMNDVRMSHIIKY